MPDLTREDRRINRKHVLDALVSETGSFGGDAAADRVKAYQADPVGSPTAEFAYVGGLRLRRFLRRRVETERGRAPVALAERDAPNGTRRG